MQALTRITGQVTELELLLDPAHPSPVLSWDTCTTRALHVFGPTTPSTARCLPGWKARTAASASSPKTPVHATACLPAPGRYCRFWNEVVLAALLHQRPWLDRVTEQYSPSSGHSMTGRSFIDISSSWRKVQASGAATAARRGAAWQESPSQMT
jgi:hypothetical protein